MTYRFSYKTYRLPLRSPLRTAHGRWSVREGIMVRLEDETGQVGYGEVAPIPWFGTETLDEAGEMCRKFGDKVAGTLLDEVPPHFGCVRFALGQARLPLATGPVPPTRLPVAALLPAGSDARRSLRSRLRDGFLAFKWKVGVDPLDEELGLLDELLGQLPAHVKFRIDANGGWTRPQAEKWLARCAERPVEYVEQPLAPEDEDGLRGLAADYPVTLALDESVARLSDARHWQGLGWRGVLVMKPALAGPLPELVKWIQGTKADVVFSSAIETALGRAAIARAILQEPLTKRAVGLGIGEIFGDRGWDGPVLGPMLDASWADAVNPEELWNALP